MKKLNNKGITLMALIITIIILIILASIGTFSGIKVVKYSQFTAFSTELKIMQTRVNKLYDEINNGERNINDIGKNISNNDLKAENAFDACNITADRADYKLFDIETIENLYIEGVSREFLVNLNTRSVISYEGFEYEGTTYYTLNQLPDSLYNVEYKTSQEQPDFDVDYEYLKNGKYKISVNNINYNGNINKWNVQFKKQDSDTWNQSKNYSFNVDTTGTYDIKIVNNEYESSIKQLEIKDIFSAEVKKILNYGISIEFDDLNEEYIINNIANNANGLIQTKNDNTNILSSSIFNSDYDASKAFDKNNSSYWCTVSGQQNDAYIGYDFGKEQIISHCFYNYESEYRAKEIKLQCSNDNNTWIDASETINLTNNKICKIVKNTKITKGYRYWRIYIMSTIGSRYATATEIQFYNTNIYDDIVSYLKYAKTTLAIDDIISYNFLGKLNNLDVSTKEQMIGLNLLEKFKNKKIGLVCKTDNTNIISSSVYNSTYDKYKAFDKHNDSYWCTATGQQNNAYIGYNFNIKTYVKNVDVYSYSYRCKDIKLQCSNDNNTWIDASDVVTFENNNDIHTIESKIQDVPYQYWRVYIVTGYDSAYTGINECEFYGI